LLHRRSPTENYIIHPQQIRFDGRIRAREVRVIMDSTNEQLGVMKTQDALRKAQSVGLNLVEVAPNANPPVCRIVDFGKFRYNLAKQDKERKTHGTKLKEIKFRVNIDGHDYFTKLRHAEEFLDKGNKVRIFLMFRGREMAHKERGTELMQRIKSDLAGMGVPDADPKQMGRNLTMTLSPVPATKRKRKFEPPQEEYVEDVEETAEAAESEG
jgi:translation initiation factor IF-3